MIAKNGAPRRGSSASARIVPKVSAMRHCAFTDCGRALIASATTRANASMPTSFSTHLVEWPTAANASVCNRAAWAGAVVCTPTTSSSDRARSMRAIAASRSDAHTTNLPMRLS